MIQKTPVFQEPPAEPGAPVPSYDAALDWFGPYEEGLWLAYFTHLGLAEGNRRLLLRFLAGYRRAPGYNGWVYELASALRRFPILQGSLGLSDEQAARLRALPADAEEDERVASRDQADRDRDEPDEWKGYRVLGTKERDLLATYRVAFQVDECRRRTVVTYRPKWSQREVWQLRVRYGPLRLWAVLTLPTGNAQRDRQLAWLVDHAPLDVPLCLFYRPLSGERKLLCLERTSWPVDPAVWDQLPSKARRLLHET